MRKISEATIVDALTHWGVNEVIGRHSNEQPCDPSDHAACLNYLLFYRSPYVGRIIERSAFQTLLVELDPNDVGRMILADGRSINKWLTDMDKSNSDSMGYLNKLDEDPTLISGKIICAAKVITLNPLELSVVVVYDGWHRMAAWAKNAQKLQLPPIQGYLMLTKKEDRLFKF